MIIRNLHKLYPPMRLKVISLLHYANTHIHIDGVIEPYETLRTVERQQSLYEGKNSWTKTSYHQLGLAIDLYPTDKHGNWILGEELNNWPHWTKLGEMGESFGFFWGGRWKSNDRVHFEMKQTVDKSVLTKIYWKHGDRAVWRHLAHIADNSNGFASMMRGDS